MSRMSKIPQLLTELKTKFRTPLNIIETGTIRNTAPAYKEGDGWSTLHIARWIKANGGSFYSIDLDTKVARVFLQQKGLLDYVNLVTNDSRDAIARLIEPVHLALLDSANDAELILTEFKLILPKVIKGGIIVIDDVIMDSRDVVKGHKVIPYAKNNGFRVVIENRLGIVYT